MDVNRKDSAAITGALIASGRAVRLVPQGCSMLPLLDGVRDSVIVSRLVGSPRRGDLLLYRDEQGDAVVHRVVAVNPDGSCDLLGDGNLTVERKIPRDQVLGRVESIQRRGRSFSAHSLANRLYSWLWLALRRYRPRLQGMARRLHRGER